MIHQTPGPGTYNNDRREKTKKSRIYSMQESWKRQREVKWEIKLIVILK